MCPTQRELLPIVSYMGIGEFVYIRDSFFLRYMKEVLFRGVGWGESYKWGTFLLTFGFPEWYRVESPAGASLHEMTRSTPWILNSTS